MTVSNLFHVGILVPNLDEAIDSFADTLGVRFTVPATAHCEHFNDQGEMRVLDLRVAFSTRGPFYVELLEAQEGGFYGAQMGFGQHHIGGWDANCEDRLRQLLADGHQVDAVQYTPEGRIIVAYLKPDRLSGTRYEIVDERRRPMMERWFDGGEFIDLV